MNKVNPYGLQMAGLGNMSNLQAMQNVAPYVPSDPDVCVVLVGGRWSGTETTIRDVAWVHDVALTLEIERGWLANTYRVKFRGKGAQAAMTELLSGAANREKKR